MFFSDETSNEYRGLNSKVYIPNYEKSKYIPLYLSGKTSKMLVAIEDEVFNDEVFSGIVINANIPFDFNIIRFFITFAIILVVFFIKKCKIFNEAYSSKSFKQEAILLILLFIFTAIIIFINYYSSNDSESDMYNKLFVNALKNKQLYLLEEPSKAFYNLQDPYDYIERSSLKRNEDYLWDTAYFEGKQYVYFGILPVLVSFLPYNLITGKYLQTSTVVLIFSILTLLVLKELFCKIINIFFENVKFKFVVYSLIILYSGSLILYLNGISRVYELVIIAGLFFVLLGLYYILESMRNERKKYKCLFMGSLFLALSVACRPTDLFASILIVPYLVKLFIDGIKNNKNSIIKMVFSVGIPYFAVGILLMLYNYLRFKNPFEFGANYQLTLINVGKLDSRVFSIPVGIITNFFSIPHFILKFPFITNHNELIEFYGYYYIENMIGGIFLLAPICFMNFYVIKVNKKTDNKSLKIIINSLLIVGLIIAILSIMKAGSNERYLVDYGWMLILSGILIFIVLYNSLKSEESKKILEKIFVTVTIITFILGILSGIVSEKEYMKNVSKEVYYKTRYIISFWE